MNIIKYRQDEIIKMLGAIKNNIAHMQVEISLLRGNYEAYSEIEMDM